MILIDAIHVLLLIISVIPLAKYPNFFDHESTASGLIVNSTMTISLLNTRDEGPDVHFRLSFGVFFGLPSFISCTRNTTTIYSGGGIDSGVNYEVVRPLYTSSSVPQVDVSFEETQTRTGAPYVYSCALKVIGQRNIASGLSHFDVLSRATSTVTVTGE